MEATGESFDTKVRGDRTSDNNRQRHAMRETKPGWDEYAANNCQYKVTSNYDYGSKAFDEALKERSMEKSKEQLMYGLERIVEETCPGQRTLSVIAVESIHGNRRS